MAFPFTGRFHLFISPWPDGGGARPWPSGAWGEERVANLDRGAGPGPMSKWKRPELETPFGVGWGEVGWGGVGEEFAEGASLF